MSQTTVVSAELCTVAIQKRGVGEAVERRAAEQGGDHGDAPGGARQWLRWASGLTSRRRAVAPGPGETWATVLGVGLERVGGADPAPAEHDRAEHAEDQPGQDPDPQHGQRGAVGLHQLQPAEAEQGQRRRPDPDPLGQPDQPVLGVGAGQPAERVVHRTQRVGRPPEPAEQQRDRHQPDPDPDEDEPEDRVGQQVRPGHQGQAGPGVRRQHQQPGHQPGGRMVDHPGQPGQRPPAERGRTAAAARPAAARRRKGSAPGRRRPPRRRTAAAGRAGRRSRAAARASAAAAGQRAFRITMVFSRWCDSTS